jgi:hypothetical protein
MQSPLLLCILLFALSGDGADPGYGKLCQPAYSVDEAVRLPLEDYHPQAGDILFFDDHDRVWQFCFNIAGAGRPMHAGLVVRLPDGELNSLEAGYNDSIYVKLLPLKDRLHEFPGVIWVRRPAAPISAEQSDRLTDFALRASKRHFAVCRILLQIGPLRCRGPLRTYVLGKPRGMRHFFLCSECVLEALVDAGLLDAETTRPGATYPRDMFFDASPNRYLNRHFKMAPMWIPPQMWQP